MLRGAVSCVSDGLRHTDGLFWSKWQRCVNENLWRKSPWFSLWLESKLHLVIMTQNHSICFHCQPVGTYTSYFSVTHIHNSVFHLINFFIHYCLVQCYFSNVSERNNKMENKGECLLLKLFFMLSLCPKGKAEAHQHDTKKRMYFTWKIKNDMFPLDRCLL